jgi:hypothetical protein
MSDFEYVGNGDVAKIIGCSRSTVKLLDIQGRLPAIAIVAGRRVWRRDDVTAFQYVDLRSLGNRRKDKSDDPRVTVPTPRQSQPDPRRTHGG